MRYLLVVNQGMHPVTVKQVYFMDVAIKLGPDNFGFITLALLDRNNAMDEALQ